jgi:hypothetical protein
MSCICQCRCPTKCASNSGLACLKSEGLDGALFQRTRLLRQ